MNFTYYNRISKAKKKAERREPIPVTMDNWVPPADESERIYYPSLFTGRNAADPSQVE